MSLVHTTTANPASENLAMVGFAKCSWGAEGRGVLADRPVMSSAVEVGIARSEKA